MKQKPRPFSAFDFIGLVVLVGLVASISGAILADTFKQDPRQQAVKNAESFARQIWVQQNQTFITASVHETDRRGPAAAETPLMSGSMGLDPWGSPYHYLARKVVSDVDPKMRHTFLRITVWSDGPNAKPETEPSQLERNNLGLSLAGDDVGFQQDFPAE